ncbi:4889_t:CDS:2 [Paraglomus brasilianum]|uniref:4889_t:CDS:1 n=1 Tax=Paraglomus brasilianum TaxID=144538 RepID=A0A9N9FXK8_9GLOM|nr:4889_t:CDS:2 [Paraglomus brasilianum]
MNSAAKSASGSFKIKIPAKRTSSSSFDQTKRRRKGQEEEAEVRVEEQFILRLQIPEEDREKFREQVRSRHYVDDIAILFKDPRHAIFKFNDQKYSARLVDLPCIIESQKTFNNKQFYKIADICQMLVVEWPIEGESQLNEYKSSVNMEDFIWPDGLAPPLRNVRRRRFRKRLSNRAIEEVEREVERLLRADAQAERVQYDLVEDVMDSEIGTPGLALDNSYEAEAEAGEEFYAVGEDAGAALERDLDLMDEDELEEAMAELLENKKKLEQEISETQELIQKKRNDLAATENPIMKERFEKTINRLTNDLESKQAQLSETNTRMNAMQSTSDNKTEQMKLE